MESDFDPQPHEEAIALIRNKPAITREVFDKLLPELRGRAFTITGIEGANVMQRVRDAIAVLPAGGEAGTWDKVKQQVVDELAPHLGDGTEEGDVAVDRRAEILMRTHGFQAFQASNWRVAQEDEDTTHLQYLATEDDRVRDSHLALNGVILPKDDPFWETHTPPWEWGCRCRIRAMNPDLVDEARADDEDRAPDNRLVMEGPMLDQLRNGTLMRDGQRFDVTPPRDKPGGSYQWNPDDLRIPVEELQKRYEPEVFSQFENFARHQPLGDATLWSWLNGKALPAPAAPAAKPALEFESVAEAKAYADETLHPDALDLTEDERAAARSYQLSSVDLNKALQRDAELSPRDKHQALQLDSAIAKSELPRPLTVYHGGGGPFWGTLKPGDEVILKSYLSTTMAEANKSFAETAWVKIRVPAGTRALYMDDLAGHDAFREEVEILLGRGSKLKLLSVVESGGMVKVEAELVP